VKNLKKGILVILCLAGILTANAQDKIVKLNGETIDSKIKKIDNNIITFKKTNNPEGPDYALETREIDKVIFENGSVQVFNGQQITSNQPAVVSPTQNPEVKKTDLHPYNLQIRLQTQLVLDCIMKGLWMTMLSLLFICLLHLLLQLKMIRIIMTLNSETCFGRILD
jgi:hypothetical protein